MKNFLADSVTHTNLTVKDVGKKWKNSFKKWV